MKAALAGFFVQGVQTPLASDEQASLYSPSGHDAALQAEQELL